MATLKGKGVVFGTDGLTLAGTIASDNGDDSTEMAFRQSANIDRDSQSVQLADDSGEPLGKVFYQFKKTLNLTVVPYHLDASPGTGTVAEAETALSGWNAAPGGTVSIVDSNGAVVDDVYSIMSSTATRSNDGVALVDLVLEAFDDTDTTTEVG